LLLKKTAVFAAVFFISGYCWQLHRIGLVWRTHLPSRFEKIAISGEYIAFYAYSQRKYWALKYTPGSIFTLFLSVFTCPSRFWSKAGVSELSVFNRQR
jgi:hypothetical protein